MNLDGMGEGRKGMRWLTGSGGVETDVVMRGMFCGGFSRLCFSFRWCVGGILMNWFIPEMSIAC